jgi:DNA-binding NtrC family response regulator
MTNHLQYLLLTTTSPFSNSDPLQPVLRASGSAVTTVTTCREARRVLRSGEPVDVVVCDLTLPDGNWSDVIRDVIESGSNASLVIRTPGADERLWSEALWRGAYDILVQPYSREEARHTMEGAARAARMLDLARRPAALAS